MSRRRKGAIYDEAAEDDGYENLYDISGRELERIAEAAVGRPQLSKSSEKKLSKKVARKAMPIQADEKDNKKPPEEEQKQQQQLKEEVPSSTQLESDSTQPTLTNKSKKKRR